MSGLLTKSQPTLDQAINAVVSASHTAAQDQSGFDGVLSNLPAFIETLDKVANSGSWLNVYICNLTLNVQGHHQPQRADRAAQPPAHVARRVRSGTRACTRRTAHEAIQRTQPTVVLAVVGTALLVVVALGAINFSKLPLINDHTGYGAAFADSGGLGPG